MRKRNLPTFLFVKLIDKVILIAEILRSTNFRNTNMLY